MLNNYSDDDDDDLWGMLPEGWEVGIEEETLDEDDPSNPDYKQSYY